MAYGESEVVAIKLAVVQGNNNDIALYWGPASWSDQQVKENGGKLLREVAEYLIRTPGLFKSAQWLQLTYRD